MEGLFTEAFRLASAHTHLHKDRQRDGVLDDDAEVLRFGVAFGEIGPLDYEVIHQAIEQFP